MGKQFDLRRTTRSFATLLFCAFAFILSNTQLYSQGGASTVTGVVRDTSGAIVPNVNVALVDQATGERRISQSNNEGFFAFTAVRPSSYTITLSTSGFSEYQQKDIVVRPAEQVRLGDVSLQIGSTSSRVEVTAQANLIPTDTAEKGTDITASQIQNLTIQGRNVVELLSIVPGAVNFGGYSGEVIGIQSGTNQFAINGIRPDSIPTLLDGADVEDAGCNCGAFAMLNHELISGSLPGTALRHSRHLRLRHGLTLRM